MSARPRELETQPLSRLLQPQSIAIIGASGDAGSINGQVLRNLRGRGFAGPLFPVNPRYEAIDGIKCYPAIEAIPEAADLAIVMLGAGRAVEAVRECGLRGIPFAIVIGAGFAERGTEGEALQRELVAAAAEHGIRLVGPNCIGLMNAPDNVFAGFGPVFGMSHLRSGDVSMVSQSGGFGFAVVNMAEELGVGFRYVVSTGNEADVTSLDFMEAFIDDPGTAVIAGYFEGIKDAARIREVGRRALAARKPVIAWKVGNSPAGERAAASHTGNLGGSAALYRGAFDQYGWIRIDDVHELVDCVQAFERGKLPAHGGVAIVTVSGGAGVLLADACASHGLAVATLSHATRAQLRDVLPAFASTENPVDVTANILNEPGLLRSALQVILQDELVASLIVVTSSLEGAIAERIAGELVALDRATPKPILVSWSSREERVGTAYEQLRAAKIPSYRTPSRCCRALAALDHFAGALRRSQGASAPSPVPRPLATSPIAVSNEYEAKQLLARIGIAAAREERAASAADAAKAAARIGFPVALKVLSRDLPHKTEAGGVKLHLKSETEVAAAYREMMASVRGLAPGARIDGVLVQEMVADGTEVILGAMNHERFGPTVMFGAGGIFTEAIEDVVFRLAPVDLPEARRMIESVRIAAVLGGARGRPRGDTEALAQAIVAVSQLVDSHPQVLELDINPLVVLPEGRGVRVVDALFQTRDDIGGSP